MAIERQHVFMAKIQADDKRGLVAELRFLAQRLERNEVSAGVSGGVTSGCIYAYRENPDQTHENYFRELDEEFETEKARNAIQHDDRCSDLHGPSVPCIIR
jgi:hypothetical protein